MMQFSGIGSFLDVTEEGKLYHSQTTLSNENFSSKIVNTN